MVDVIYRPFYLHKRSPHCLFRPIAFQDRVSFTTLFISTVWSATDSSKMRSVIYEPGIQRRMWTYFDLYLEQIMRVEALSTQAEVQR